MIYRVWESQGAKTVVFLHVLGAQGGLGALWGPRGAQRAIFENFRVHLGPPFGDILGACWLLFSTSFSDVVFGGLGVILEAFWARFSE